MLDRVDIPYTYLQVKETRDPMPNVLKKEKQIAIISGLAEGMSMRALSRVHPSRLQGNQ